MSEIDLEVPAMNRIPAARSRSMATIARTQVVDACSRVLARTGQRRVVWSQVAQEIGKPDVPFDSRWFPDIRLLVAECYARAAESLEESLISAETARGNGLEKLAVFLVAALEARRTRGALLALRRAADLPAQDQKRLRERDMMIRTRIKRLLLKGQADGSVSARSVDCACELVLAALQVPTSDGDDPAQRTWDGELIDMLLTALANPAAPA
jgi:hypothetical protein